MNYQDYKEAKVKAGKASIKKVLLSTLKELESDLQHMVVRDDGSKHAQKIKIQEVKIQLNEILA